jgi:predicted HAD superfamily Cof-like phosphohydrolase
MKPDDLKACTVCGSGNLNSFDVDAAGGHYPIWWCEDCGSLTLSSNTDESLRTWQPEHSMLNRQVLAFHKRFGQSIGAQPHTPAEAVIRFRLSLIAEEFFELLEAAGLKGVGNETCQTDHGTHGYENESEFVPRDMIASDIQNGAIEVDMPAFVDALADLMYVIEGAAITMGVNMTPILAEVHAANMRKLPSYVSEKDAQHQGVTKREDGKILKPKDWVGPDISGELKKQGHDG